MLKDKARDLKLEKRIIDTIEKYNISGNITHSVQSKDGIYQCVIKYQVNNKWKPFWATTGLKEEKGNLRNARNRAREIADLFEEKISEKQESRPKEMNIIDFQALAELNTTNYNPNKITKADWDFYEYMEYWLYKIIKKSVEEDTFAGYERNVTKWMKKYFTDDAHKKTVKQITADDLEDFYDYLRDECNLKNASVDHYNDNISSAFKSLLKKKLVRYNPTDLVDPIVVDVVEVPTYNKSEILQLFEILKGDTIELPVLFDGFYGLRRSEIIGLRTQVFDFEQDNFIINHVAIQRDGKNNPEKVYFKDKTKSKKGYRSMPLFAIIKQAVEEKINRIEENKKIFGNSYNHKYDGYICVQDNGDIIQPNYFTKRFKKIIDRNHLKKITPHGLRHSIATLLHLEGVDIRDLQDWLGHQNISSTNRYTRSDYKKQVATGNVVSKLFGTPMSTNNENKLVEEIPNIENKNTKRFICKKKSIHNPI